MDAFGNPIDAQEALARLEGAFSHLRRHFVGRDDVLEQMLYAVLTREHSLLIGDRGLAKSRLVRSVFAQFETPVPLFSLQLTRSTSVGQLVGGLDLTEFERGTYIHNLDGYIVRAQFAFLDELFDANDFVLRSLNGILNEREFLNGPQVEHAALHSAFATTNYIRDTRESRAVLDRLLFKAVVHRAESALHKFAIRREFIQAHGGTVFAVPGSAVPYDWLAKLSRVVLGEDREHAIRVPAHVLVMLDALISEFEIEMNERRTDERFVFSDRSKNKSINVLMASALRSGRNSVEVRDLASLRFLIPTIGSAEEEEVFAHALNRSLRTFTARDREAVDQAAAIVDVLSEAVERHHQGTLGDPKWTERMRVKIGRFIHLDQSFTLGSLLDEARNLNADSVAVQKLKEEVLGAIRDAHDRHQIAYEQRL